MLGLIWLNKICYIEKFLSISIYFVYKVDIQHKFRINNKGLLALESV